jgi:plasmid stabilization system protein ParE
LRHPFVITPQARRDLKEILLDIAEDSVDTAERLRAEFYAALRKLARSPGIGHFHDELMSRKYRFWNFYSYAIVYAWETKPIRIITVVHGSRDLVAYIAARQGSD